MTTFPLLNDNLMKTPTLLMTTTTTYMYREDSNNKLVGGDDRVRIYVKSAKSSFISIKAVTKLIVSRRKAVITTLQRVSLVRFLVSVMRETGGFRTVHGLTSLMGSMCLFYGFYYIKYIKKYTGKYTDRYIFEAA